MKIPAGILALFLLSVAAAAGWAADEAEPTRAADLMPPVLITATGGPIVAPGRCPALTTGDFDDDGRMDLLVGQMSEGRLRIYRNVGTAGRPEFGKATDFMAGGRRACVPSGCYTAFSPQWVDFDGDGRTDVLSPSFNVGIYLFRRTADGTFAAAEMLDDRHGQPIKFRYNGTALPCDWDADGDLDLLVRGVPTSERYGVNLLVNEGTRRKPAYGELVLLTAANERLLGNPCAVVDWDGDGRKDLLTCAGSVYWYRNTGEKGQPELQPAEILVPSGRYETVERRSDEPRQIPSGPGRIDSLAAADLNGDGRLDLLAAGTWSERVDLSDLTDEEQAAKEKIEAEADSLSRKWRDLCKEPENETREARRERQRSLLRAWQQWAAVRASLEEFRSHRDYGCLWLFERTAAEN